MSQQKSHAEHLFGQGLMTYLAGEGTASNLKAIELFREALKSGLPRPKEIFCHMYIGGVTLMLARGSEEMDRLSEQAISNLPNLSTAMTELETALSLDIQSGERNLGSRLNQALTLQPLDFLWMSQSIYIKKRQGPDSELSYLQDKLKKIEYLNTSLPGLCLSFSYHYGEANNKPLAIEWLRRAVNADTYSDVEETRTLTYFKIAQGYKNQAQEMLQSLSSSSEKKRATREERRMLHCYFCLWLCACSRSNDPSQVSRRGAALLKNRQSFCWFLLLCVAAIGITHLKAPTLTNTDKTASA
jgi:hypothetical protein